MERNVVDANSSAWHSVEKILLLSPVLTKVVQRKGIASWLNQSRYFGDVLVRQDRKDGAEDLFLHDGHGVIDDYNREGLAIDVDLYLPSARVIRALEHVIEWRGKPAAIRCDNGPELLSGPLIAWANKNRITMLYIQPGKPTQNAYIERFNRTARHE